MRRILFFCLLSFYASAQTGNEGIQVTDLLKIQTAGKPIFAPDGKQFIFTVTSVVDDADKKDDFLFSTHIYLGDVASGAYRPLTFGKNSVSAPAWSPDGKSISFVRDLGNKSQVYLLPLAGGEAQAITSIKSGVQNPSWAKQGNAIYYQTSFTLKEFLADSLLNPTHKIPSWSLEKPQRTALSQHAKPNPNGSMAEIRAYLDKNEKDKKAKVINRLQFQEETTTSGEIMLTALYKLDLVPNAKPILVNDPFVRWQDFDELPNGDFIVTMASDTLSHPDRVLDNSIVWLHAGTKKALRSKTGFRYSNLSLNDSGTSLAYFESASMGVANPVLHILDLATQMDQTIPYDRVITQLEWSKAGDKIYFTAQDHGAIPLIEYTLSTKSFETRTSMDEGVLGFDVHNQSFVYAKTGISNPSEIYVDQKVFTRLNADWLASRKLAPVVKKTFVNKIGQTIDYWVMKPLDAQSDKKYPVVLEIHGGPTAMWGTGELSMWHEFQYYAAKGMGVVYCNPRGSGGYGSAFMASNVKDWGHGPMADVMQSLNLTIKEGWVDTTRMAVSGGSYAGYLVSWIVGHTNRFKVASSQRGVYELSTFFGEGNASRLVPNYFGGYPWEKQTKSLLASESPLTYVANIKTPLLIFHGENDLRTGVIQSEMLYKSLKQLGREVEYVRHPGASHEITRSGNNRQRIDQMLRTYEFFARYFF